MVRVPGRYPEGPGFESQLDPDFSVDPNDLALPLQLSLFMCILMSCCVGGQYTIVLVFDWCFVTCTCVHVHVKLLNSLNDGNTITSHQCITIASYRSRQETVLAELLTNIQEGPTDHLS